MRAPAACAVAALAACASCIYTTVTALPAHIRTVRVEMFENRSGYPALEAELTRLVVRELQADGVLRPVSRHADAILRGTVTTVGRSVLQEDAHDDVVTGRVTVAAVISLEDVSTGKKILEDTRVTSVDARGEVGLYRLARGETEVEGRASALSSLARGIARRVVEVW